LPSEPSSVIIARPTGGASPQLGEPTLSDPNVQPIADDPADAFREAVPPAADRALNPGNLG